MHNISAQTSLPPSSVMAEAHEYFVKKQELVLIECVKQLRGRTGAVQITVAGGATTASNISDSETIFKQLTDFVQNQHGLTPVYLRLHLQASRENDHGQLLVQANFSNPVRVTIETRDYESQARRFVAGLPL